MDKRTKEIIGEFIKWFKSNSKRDHLKIEGLLLAGSFVFPDKLSLNSDLDLFVAIKDNGKRYRGIKKINDVDVDYFINSIAQYRHDFEKAKETDRKTFLYVLANGLIIEDRQQEFLTLQKEAKKYLKFTAAKGIPDPDLVLAKYFIDDLLKDIEDDLENGDNFAFQYNLNLLSNYLIETFCRYFKIGLVKPKYQKNEISKEQPEFVRLFGEFSESRSKEEKFKAIKKLAFFALESMGGKNPAEWEIKSDSIA
ncbi:MAG: hypothetical protein PHQ47_02750 [Candidatus Portnoybacteria bacterium]|nr:hypothetical protein [Candidatus Portnoybacteria bacterium]